eukprot:1219349-Pyramimonas_sp.AAC.1
MVGPCSSCYSSPSLARLRACVADKCNARVGPDFEAYRTYCQCCSQRPLPMFSRMSQGPGPVGSADLSGCCAVVS